MSAGERAPARPASARARLWIAALLVLAVGALYGQTARHGFVYYDDGAYLTENPHVRSGLTADNARWAFGEFHSANWHPLTWLSHQLDVELFGLEAGKHHLVNAGLHALNAVLCFCFLARATGSWWASALVALLFAVHPQRVESVAWAAERKDVLSGAFFFLTLLAYERYARAPAAGRYGLVVLCFALGLLAKPMLVTLPVVLLWLDVWPLERWSSSKPAHPSSVGKPSQTPTHPARASPATQTDRGGAEDTEDRGERKGRSETHLDRPPRVSATSASPRSDRESSRRARTSGSSSSGARAKEPGQHSLYGLLLEKLPLFALAAASVLVTVLAQRAGNAVRSMEVLALDQRLATALLGTVAYLSNALWPAGLAFFYPHPAFVTPAEFEPTGVRVWIAALVPLALTFVAWRLRARLPMLLVGWAWMLVMLLPVIGLVQVGAQFYADRYAYLPLLGFTFALVFGARALCPNPAVGRALFALGLLAAAALAVVTYRQVGSWKDTRALCERALAVTERNYVAHEHLALTLQREGQLELAREHYLATLAIVPDIYTSHNNLGFVYIGLGQRERAVAEFQEALRLVPTFLDARLNWGLLFELEGDPAGALTHYEIAVRQHPESAAAWTKLGDAFLGLARPAEARDAYQRAVECDGSSADAQAGLGMAWIELGDEPTALQHLARALHLVPGHAQAVHGEAWIHATSAAAARRDPARALALLAGCAARGERANWRHLRVVAAALAAEGRREEAARAAAEASAVAPASEWARLKAERELYQAGRALGR